MPHGKFDPENATHVQEAFWECLNVHLFATRWDHCGGYLVFSRTSAKWKSTSEIVRSITGRVLKICDHLDRNSVDCHHRDQVVVD
jgi:hypothetical protein